jgi:CRP-like cAMP-binding protein
VFGEAAVVSNLPRTASVVAVTEVTLLRLSQQTIEDGLSGDRWENLLVQTLIQRFREVEARLADVEGSRE